jgi:hypothetical protein
MLNNVNNTGWEQEIVPKSGKQGTILLLYKSGGINDLSDHSSITLVAILRIVLSIVLVIVVLGRLEYYVLCQATRITSIFP